MRGFGAMCSSILLVGIVGAGLVMTNTAIYAANDQQVQPDSSKKKPPVKPVDPKDPVLPDPGNKDGGRTPDNVPPPDLKTK